MHISAKDKVLSRIKANGTGWVFSATDFTPILSRYKIDRSFADLAKEGMIRRIRPGLYDYPKYSKILEKTTAPDMHKTAEAIARKYGWHIYPDGNTALNYFDLSTQIVAKNIYMSDGPNKQYLIGNRELIFKHTTTKDVTKHPETILVIQAIKAIGKEQISDDFLVALSSKFSHREWARIRKDASRTTGWVYACICQITDRLETTKNG